MWGETWGYCRYIALFATIKNSIVKNSLANQALSLSLSRSCWPHCVKVEHLMGLNRAEIEAVAEAEAFQVHSRLPIPFQKRQLEQSFMPVKFKDQIVWLPLALWFGMAR